MNSTSPSDFVYNRLKITAQLILPAIGALYFALAQIWGFPAPDKVNGTIAAVNLFVGVVVMWMKSIHEAKPIQYDGSMTWEDNEDGSQLRLKQIDPKALYNRDEIRLRIENPGRHRVAE